MLMSAATAPSNKSTTPLLHTQGETSLQQATQFAAATAQLLQHLTLGATGSALAPLLDRAVTLLTLHNVRIERNGDTVLANDQAIAPTASTAWRSQLQVHGIQHVDFHHDASAAELLHFLALLTGPTGDVSVACAWLARGAWRIHLQVVDVPVEVHDVNAHDAIRLLNELVSDNRSLRREITDEELDTLCHAVAQGVSVAEDSALLIALRLAGEAAVRSLLVALSNATSGSQRRRLFETVAKLNVGHQYLVALLSHSAWFVVRNAASLLGELRVAGADASLAALLDHEDCRVRVAAITALGAFQTDVASQSLLAAVTDSSAAVRAAAWSMWQHRDHPPAVDTINRSLREEPDHAAQRAVLNCVARFDTLDVANALVRFCAHGAETSAPIDLLTFAIELLAQRRPQHARQFVKLLAEAHGR